MKQLSQLPIIKEISASKPFGAIINETDTEDGTPVVREIYNDPLINIYKLLQVTNIAPDGTEDGETNGVGGQPKYQIIDALKKLANNLNDIEQVLTISGGVWSVPLELSILPNKYVFIARAADAYVSGGFKGSEANPIYDFFSPGFNASDELIVIIDQSTVRAYSISGLFGNQPNELFTLLGIPVAYNDSNTLCYQEDGSLLSDVPNVAYIQEVIRGDVSDNSVLVTDMFIMQGFLLCVLYMPTENTYRFRQFNTADYSESFEVTLENTTIPEGLDNAPYFYADGETLLVTNNMGNTDIDAELANAFYVPETASLFYNSTVTLNDFTKTTNVAIKNKTLYSMVNGVLAYHDINSGDKTTVGSFNAIVGQLFNYKDNVYFTSGEVARKWF